MDYGKDAIALFSKQLIRWGHSYDCLYGPGDKPCNNEVAMAILNKPQSTSPSCFCTCGTMLTFTFSLNIDLTPLQRYKCHHRLCHTYWGHSQSNAHWNLLPSDYYIWMYKICTILLAMVNLTLFRKSVFFNPLHFGNCVLSIACTKLIWLSFNR